MDGCKVEDQEAPVVVDNMLVGLLFFDDGSCLPTVFMDFSEDPGNRKAMARLYRRKLIKNLSVKIEREQVSVESRILFLDGTKREDVVVKFIPEAPIDSVAFRGALAVTHVWLLAVRQIDHELHFKVSIEDNRVIQQYISYKLSKIVVFGDRK